MMLIAAKRSLSSSPVSRQWRDTCVLACRAACHADELDSLGTLQLGDAHGRAPGG
jgi:hypothetical protein